MYFRAFLFLLLQFRTLPWAGFASYSLMMKPCSLCWNLKHSMFPTNWTALHWNSMFYLPCLMELVVGFCPWGHSHHSMTLNTSQLQSCVIPLLVVCSSINEFVIVPCFVNRIDTVCLCREIFSFVRGESQGIQHFGGSSWLGIKQQKQKWRAI